jgi:hypothetical protein
MGRSTPTYPYVPTTNASLEPGQFWAVPLSDGRFACGRVLRIDRQRAPGGHTLFVAGLLDWVGDRPPNADTIAGARLLAVGNAQVRSVPHIGSALLGHRPLSADGIAAPEVVTNTWGLGFMRALAERQFVRPDAAREWEVRSVASPLTDEMLRPFEARRGVVQFRSLLSDDEFRRLAEWLRAHPQVKLRAYGSYDGSIADLDFLRFFPFVRAFSADALHDSLRSLQGLAHLSDELEDLTIGATRHRLDLGIIGRFRSLRTLSLDGHLAGVAILSELTALEDLTLRSITLPNLAPLLPLRRLLALHLKLGSAGDLALLPEVGRLQHVELWMIRGLSDISAVGRMPHLRYLVLQALRRVEQLPDLSAATELRRVHLVTMRGIRDLGPLASAPALEELALMEMGHLQPDDLRCLVALPKLRAVTPHLGSLERYEAAKALLPLPDVPQLRPDWRGV